MDLLTLIALGSLIAWLYWECVGKRAGLPPGPTPLPFIGNMLQLDPADVPGSFALLARKHGSTFTFWLGKEATVVLTDQETLRTTVAGRGADAFTGRPFNYAIQTFYDAENAGMASSNGAKWSETRRFSVQALRDLGLGRSSLEGAIREEGRKMLDHLDEMLGGEREGLVDPTEPLTVGTVNVISHLLFNYTHDRAAPGLWTLRDNISKNSEALGSFAALLLSSNPWLRFVPVFRHFGYDELRETHRDYFSCLRLYVERIKANFDVERDEPRCFVEAYLKEIHRRETVGDASSAFTETQMICVVGDFWAGGFETSVSTLRWALIYMAQNPSIQRRVQGELDAFYGALDADVEVKMEDRPSLPYTVAAMMEAQRLGNIVPLNLAHSLTRDVEIDGYELKRGTAIIPSLSSVMSDPKLFPAPEQFKPERFLDAEGRLLKSDSWMPFSLGKRNCAGESLARMELHMFFVILLRRFRFGISASDGDLNRAVSGFIRKPQPFKLVASDRRRQA